MTMYTAVPIETAIERGVKVAWEKALLRAGHDVCGFVGEFAIDSSKCQVG